MATRRIRELGFTLIEMLVVMGIISIMIGMLMPALHKARDMARKSSCQNNLHQLNIANHQFSDVYRREPRTNNGNNPGGW